MAKAMKFGVDPEQQFIDEIGQKSIDFDDPASRADIIESIISALQEQNLQMQ